MRTGACLALVTVGAILAFAVTGNTSFLNLHTVGYVLIIVGVVGLYLRSRGWAGRQFLVRRRRTLPGTHCDHRGTRRPAVRQDQPGDLGGAGGHPGRAHRPRNRR